MDEIAASVDRAWLARFVAHGFLKQHHREGPVQLLGRPRYTPLHDAAKAGDLFVLRGRLGKGADCTTRDERGKTVLEVAHEANRLAVANYIEWGHAALVRALAVSLGRAPMQKEIYAAATHKRMRRFRFLVRRRMDEAFKRLIAAARDGDLATVRSMIENGEIGVNVVDEATEETAFSAALASGHRAVCIYLMQRGAGFHGVCWIQGERHVTLVAAVLTEDVGFVRRVVAHDASVLTPTARDTTKTCAVVEAARFELLETMEYLLDVGGSFDPDRNGLDLPPIVKERLYAIALPSAMPSKEAEPWLLLCVACWLQNVRLFKHLFETREEIQDLSASPKSAAVVLFFAAYKDNEAFVLELLRRGAPVNENLGRNVTPMAAAVVTNSTKMLQLLIDRGGDVFVTSYCGIIPDGYHDDSLLTSAVSFGAMDCARMLLPLDTRPNHRERALAWAAIRGEVEFAALLLDELTPTTLYTLISIISCTRCPITLDLLLTWYCSRGYPISDLHNALASACMLGKNPDLLAVFLAHGTDIMDDTGGNFTSRLMDGVIRNVYEWPCEVTLRFVVDNGIPIVTLNKSGRTPEQELSRLYAHYVQHNKHDDFKPEEFAACRHILADHDRRSKT